MATTSLGRLTVDLMMKTGGLEKGTREGRKRFKELDDAVKKTEKTVKVSMAAAGAAVVGYAAAIAKITTAQMELIKTQDTLAKSLNGTITGIKAVNAAAADKGIEGMDGSLARLQRRLGAFQNTGGGPAAGAIKALKLDAQELAEVDADEKIMMITRALEEMNATTAESARYLQDLGFQQKGVTELFKDGGQAVAEHRKAIEEMGRAVSQVDVAKIAIAKREFDAMGDSVDAMKTQLAKELAPVLGAVAKTFNSWAQEGANSVDFVSRALDTTIEVAGFVADAMHGVKVAGQTAFILLQQSVRGLIMLGLEMADTYVNGPIKVFDALIDASNLFLGTTFENIESVKVLREVADSFAQDAEDGWSTLHNLWMEELPSEGIERFVATAKEEYQRLAEEQVALEQEVADKKEEIRQQEYVKLSADAKYRLEMAKATGVAETEIQLLELQSRQAQLSDALADKSITEQEFIQQSEIAWAQYNQNLQRLDDAYARQKLQGTAQLFGNLSTLMNTQSRKLFEIGKAAAYAQTIVSTAEAAMSSYKAMASIPYVGPALGAAAAAAAVVAGGVQLSNIANTKFGGSSAPAQTPTAQINAATEPVGLAQAPQQDIYIRGLDRDSLYSGDQVLELVNEAINSGGRLVGAS